MNNQVDLKHRVWRFSGFSQGYAIGHEFAGPQGGSPSFPYRPICIIGRDPETCHFVINDPTVSRLHAELRYMPDYGVGIADRRSTFGTFVDGVQISSDMVPLRIGQTVRLGHVELMISYPR